MAARATTYSAAPSLTVLLLRHHLTRLFSFCVLVSGTTCGPPSVAAFCPPVEEACLHLPVLHPRRVRGRDADELGRIFEHGQSLAYYTP